MEDTNVDKRKDSSGNTRLNNILQQHNLNLKQLASTMITIYNNPTSTTIVCCITSLSSVTVRVLGNIISGHHGVDCTINMELKSTPSPQEVLQ